MWIENRLSTITPSMPGSFMTGYAGFGIADEQQGEFMGKPPWMRQTRDSARMGEWYLHMFGITLAGDWRPIAVLPILFGPGGIMP